MGEQGEQWANEGQRLLVALGLGQREVARMTSKSPSTVHAWFAGRKVPETAAREVLAGHGIPAEAWSRVPSQQPAAPSPAPSLPSVGPVSTRGELEAQVARLRGRLGDSSLSPSAAVQVERALGQALASLAKLDGSQVSEVMILRHPAWLRVQAVILTALEPYPDALCAVSDALKATGG